uniref:Uncharacterized protein n=1 Tax=Serinus canaria TaxID=9135 RepID=A0A8C9MVS7_SERCA
SLSPNLCFLPVLEHPSHLCRLEHGGFLGMASGELSSAVRAVVLGVTGKSSSESWRKAASCIPCSARHAPGYPGRAAAPWKGLWRSWRMPVLVGANEARSCLSCS